MSNHNYNYRFNVKCRSSRPNVFFRKGPLRNFAKFTGKNLYFSNFIKKETLKQVFHFEFSKIFKITFFIEHLRQQFLRDCSSLYYKMKSHLYCFWKYRFNYSGNNLHFYFINYKWANSCYLLFPLDCSWPILTTS